MIELSFNSLGQIIFTNATDVAVAESYRCPFLLRMTSISVSNAISVFKTHFYSIGNWVTLIICILFQLGKDIRYEKLIVLVEKDNTIQESTNHSSPSYNLLVDENIYLFLLFQKISKVVKFI